MSVWRREANVVYRQQQPNSGLTEITKILLYIYGVLIGKMLFCLSAFEYSTKPTHRQTQDKQLNRC